MISKEDIDHLKDLARVEFGEKETEKLAKDMGDILGYIDILKEARVEGASDIISTSELKNVFRADASAPSSAKVSEGEESPRELIDAFPEKTETEHGAYLKVKSILK